MNFSDLGLGQKTLEGVQDAGYQTPTPIQQKVIPYVLARRDLFGCAQTGTGKTASYTLPLLDLLEKGRARAAVEVVRGEGGRQAAGVSYWREGAAFETAPVAPLRPHAL